MSTEHIRQHPAVSSEINHQFGANRVLTGIRNDVRLTEAFAVVQQIRLGASKYRGAADFSQLNRHLAASLLHDHKRSSSKPPFNV